MSDTHGRLGFCFENWLEENGIREEVTSEALKAVPAEQIADAMTKQRSGGRSASS